MKWLTSLLARTRKPSGADENVQSIDPKSLMFSIPTISDDLAPLDPVGEAPRDDELQMHEDDWCQVEFFHKGYLQELQRLLKEYKTFEASNREMITIEGKECPIWLDTYVRTVARQPLLSGEDPVEQLGRIVEGQIGPAPVLFSTSSWSGRVRNGFTVGIGRNMDLYGYVVDGDVPVIAALVRADPDDQALVTAFARLNAALGLVLVDWRSQLILVDTSPEGEVQVWRP